MAISADLGEKLESVVTDLVKNGRYNSKSEVLREGVRLVQEGPTLVLTLDAHASHPDPFTADEMIPYRSAQPPPSQQAAVASRGIMRKARSSKQRPSRICGTLPRPSCSAGNLASSSHSMILVRAIPRSDTCAGSVSTT